MTQEQMLREHLDAGNSITQREAIALFGITRLSAVIYALKHSGMQINKTVEAVKNRFGTTVYVARYRRAE